MTSAHTRVYRSGPAHRSVDRLYTALTRLGLGASYRHLLTVIGRSSGLPRTTPVDVMEHDGTSWLVAPYGVVNWVKNLRGAGIAELRRGRTVRTFDAEEVSPELAAAVIRQYIARVPVTRAYWGVSPDATIDELRAEARTHPVFRLTPVDRPRRADRHAARP
jgi:deazaflavin-dependent oxidoreductase (nitroreductase family)